MSRGVVCPHCSHDESRVINSRPTGDLYTRRRRVCAQCGERYTTVEAPLEVLRRLEYLERVHLAMQNAAAQEPVCIPPPTPAEYAERKRQILAETCPGSPRRATNGVMDRAAPRKPQAPHNGVRIPFDEVGP